MNCINPDDGEWCVNLVIKKAELTPDDGRTILYCVQACLEVDGDKAPVWCPLTDELFH
jgi:hypothetical protein